MALMINYLSCMDFVILIFAILNIRYLHYYNMLMKEQIKNTFAFLKVSQMPLLSGLVTATIRIAAMYTNVQHDIRVTVEPTVLTPLRRW